MNRCGYDVVAVVSTPAAMSATRRVQPHALVLDLAVTGELGLKVLPHLLAASPGVAIVVLSSFESLTAAAVEAGAYDLLARSDLRLLERSLLTVALRQATPDTATA